MYMYVQCNNDIIICFQAGWAQFLQRWANWHAPNSLVFIVQLIENCSATAEEKDFQQILILLWLNLYFPCISCYLRKLIRVGRLFDFTAYEVGAYLGESAYYSVGAYSRKYAMHYGDGSKISGWAQSKTSLKKWIRTVSNFINST